ncbi:MAG: translation initiation factor IF-3 [Porticoccaceae bacterium]|nr:translation initiation factor IF-3 [Porticoccaceae bacterium]MBT3528521.1 translation initiation factor IF-3 [Porticoccaceae bacterium]MBT4213213.1 translation initiation factor IF-3 [Porticoccaceae bacterium]MBT5071735.1 translation initiation factor IF-3 [Porticoccaceae bacterium]MBT7563940.1 translation initiation factor IF-3 [Porticoccaceae bacterium]
MKKDSKRARLNDDITAAEVRLVASDGSQVGVVSLEVALETAQKETLDLVEISPDAEPPVCKVMDYGKHVFDIKKKVALQKKKQKQTQVKEMKFRPGTDQGDYDIKLRNLVRFLEHGDKAKVTLRFRGREMAHQELGMEMMKRVEADLTELAQVEQYPKMEGRQMTMVLAPRSKKK